MKIFYIKKTILKSIYYLKFLLMGNKEVTFLKQTYNLEVKKHK